MDPIEKLLSELAPARGSDALDRAMDRQFRRAEAVVRRRQILRSFGMASLFLVIGVGAGFQLGKSAGTLSETPALEHTVNTEVPVIRERPVFDFTTAAGGPGGSTETYPNTTVILAIDEGV